MARGGGLLVAGFEDGVVRLLELLDPQKLPSKVGVGPTEPARLTLQQAFKPHNGPVTAAAYDKNGNILATGVRRSSGGLGSPDPRLQGWGLSWGVSWWWGSTGVLSVCVLVPQSSDRTVFFFSVGDRYHPVGFIHVPGPVQGLQWSSFPVSLS